MEQAKEVLQAFPLTKIPPPPSGKVLTLRSDMNMGEAIAFLHENNILGAPIRNVQVPDSAPWKDKYMGLFDYSSAVVVLLDQFGKKPAIPEEIETSVETFHQCYLEPLASELSSLTLDKLSEDDPFFFVFLPLDVNVTSLLDACVLLGNFRVKRIPLVNGPDGDIVNFVTQSSIVRYIYEHKEKFGFALDKSLKELNLANPVSVHTINWDQPIKLAFQKMKDESVSAIPVLGVDGNLVGNISNRHLYYVVTARNKLRMLTMEAAHFLALVDQTDLSALGISMNIKSPAITCKETDTLGHVMHVMSSSNIHRIYIVNELCAPVRVVSLCDLLASFVQEPINIEGCSIL